MRDRFYERSAVERPNGKWQLHAAALGMKIYPNYPPYWFCTHDEEHYHESEEEALNCAQYADFRRQLS
jgi:hypothetical protein